MSPLKSSLALAGGMAADDEGLETSAALVTRLLCFDAHGSEQDLSDLQAATDQEE